MTLSITPAALAETPNQTSNDGVKIAAPNTPKFYSEELRVPDLTYISEKVGVKEDEDAILLIEFSGYPVPTVFVFHNGTLINLMETMKDKSPKYIVTSTSRSYALRIRKCVPSDAGTYVFRVANNLGSVDGAAFVNVVSKGNYD